MVKKTGKRIWKRILIISLATVVLLLAGTYVVMKLMYPGMTFVSPAKIEAVTSSAQLFKYDPAKIGTGTVYHYTKSNTDGTKPGFDSIYISDSGRLEVFKIYPGSSATFYVTADMDWDVFSAKALDGYEIYKDGSRKLVLHSELMKSTNEYLIDGAQKYTVPVGHYPVHIFNFDFISLNFSFRHLADPESSFSIGVLYPNFDISSFIKFVYPGEAEIKYLGEESRNGSECRKYGISGPGIANGTGFIWVNRKGGYVEDMEINASDNPGWATFKFQLTGIEEMSRDEWNEYVVKQSEEYFAGQRK